MFTKNWYIGLAGALGSGTTSGLINVSGETPSTTSASNLKYWTIFGDGYNGYNYSYYSYPYLGRVEKSTSSYSGVIFGTGSTAPTVDDYKLSGSIVTGFSYSATKTSVTYSDTGMTVSWTYSITSTASSDITIREVGLIASTSGSSGAANMCLLDRTILDEPVTIPAGGVGQVTYTITMDYPTE